MPRAWKTDSRVNCTMMSTFAVHGFHHGSACVPSLNSPSFYNEPSVLIYRKKSFICCGILPWYIRQNLGCRQKAKSWCFKKESLSAFDIEGILGWPLRISWWSSSIPHGYIKTKQMKNPKPLCCKQHPYWYIQHGTWTGEEWNSLWFLGATSGTLFRFVEEIASFSLCYFVNEFQNWCRDVF